MDSYIILANFIDSADPDHLRIVERGSLVVEQGRVSGLVETPPDCCAGLPVLDFGERIVIPGMSDLHLHAPQFTFRGLGMDMELLDWLNTYTFPEEARYADASYARRAYEIFTQALRRSATTRAAIFATIHVEATLLLMELLEQSGLRTCVGKVNMDRNSPPELIEAGPEAVGRDTERWIEASLSRFTRTKPILTPRFIPSCTDETMRTLKLLQRKYDLPTQSHLSENLGEIAWVRELAPESKYYGDAYERFGMFGGDHSCIMAHCVHTGPEELELIRRNGVYIAHSPESNINLSSGVAPINRFLDAGCRVGLATDLAAGSHESMLRAVTHAIQASKLRWRLLEQDVPPLSVERAFYLATAGGGSFFGKVGRFAPGYEFDALVLDDENLPSPRELPTRDRFERLLYLADERNIVSKFVAGERLF